MLKGEITQEINDIKLLVLIDLTPINYIKITRGKPYPATVQTVRLSVALNPIRGDLRHKYNYDTNY